METNQAIAALAALAQETRLEVFRHLVRQGPEGAPAGDLAAALGVQASTLSFHLRQLEDAGLIAHERRSRQLIYAIAPAVLNDLFFFLGEDCCQGRRELCPAPTERMARLRRDEIDEERPVVLFICSQNSARSQMAEALLRHEAGEEFQAMSAGLRPARVHPMTLTALREIGVETSALVANDLADYLGKVKVRDAIVVCDQAQRDCPRIYPFARHRHYWPFPDPVSVAGAQHSRIEDFREVRDAIHQRIRDFVASDRNDRKRRRTS